MPLSPLIQVMTRAAIKAGRGLMRDFGELGQLQVSRKGTANFVTAADVRTEQMLQRELGRARPDFGFLMEEGGALPGKDPTHWWIVDPLDGTHNFIHAVPYFCVAIALEKRIPGKPSDVLAGVVYDPVHNDLFWAEKGQGAFHNDRRLHVSGRAGFEEAMLVTGQPFLPEDLQRLGLSIADRMMRSGASVRNFGASALDLAHLAAGRYDGCWYTRLQPWDIAASLLLIAEAGGKVTDLDGNPATPHVSTLLASNGLLHPKLLPLTAKAA
jgi:myo-inositol-1(or 4)-monophosphatase